MKWKLYWGGLGLTLTAAALWKNRRHYPDRSWKFCGVKSVADVALTCFVARFLSPLLVSLSTVYVFQQAGKRFHNNLVVRCVAGTLTAMATSWLSSWCLEAVLFAGVTGVTQQVTDMVVDWETYFAREEEQQEQAA